MRRRRKGGGGGGRSRRREDLSLRSAPAAAITQHYTMEEEERKEEKEEAPPAPLPALAASTDDRGGSGELLTLRPASKLRLGPGLPPPPPQPPRLLLLPRSGSPRCPRVPGPRAGSAAPAASPGSAEPAQRPGPARPDRKYDKYPCYPVAGTRPGHAALPALLPARGRPQIVPVQAKILPPHLRSAPGPAKQSGGQGGCGGSPESCRPRPGPHLGAEGGGGPRPWNPRC